MQLLGQLIVLFVVVIVVLLVLVLLVVAVVSAEGLSICIQRIYVHMNRARRGPVSLSEELLGLQFVLSKLRQHRQFGKRSLAQDRRRHRSPAAA